MKKNQKKSILLIAIITLSFGACKEKTPSPTTPPENESELITTVKLVFTDTATKAVSTAVFSDLDGPGGNAPTQFDTIRLKPNTVYQTAIYLLDETKTPVDSISNEVLEEGQDHLFVFTKVGVNLNIQISDKDINSLPLGLLSYWSTAAVSNGSVTVALKHQPGVKDGSAAPGETDVEILFPCRIQ